VVDELKPGKDWSVHWYRNDHIQMDYALKTECKNHYEGSTCSDFKPHYQKKKCTCTDDEKHNHRHKREITGPEYDLSKDINKVTEPVTQPKCEKQNEKQSTAVIAPAVADSIVTKLSEFLAESVEAKEKTSEATATPSLTALMTKLTGIIEKNAAGLLKDVVKDDVVQGRQMVMRVASMINETVQAINPFLGFMNAIITMLRATRYLLLAANFMG
jgi:hypothetical protein